MAAKLTIERPRSVIRLNYHNTDPNWKAFMGVWANPAEVRMGVGDQTFVSITDGSISLSPGRTNKINIQGMTQDVVYGGIITDLPFPLSMIPTTPFTPWPNQIFNPPLRHIIADIRDTATVAVGFLASKTLG